MADDWKEKREAALDVFMLQAFDSFGRSSDQSRGGTPAIRQALAKLLDVWIETNDEKFRRKLPRM